MLILSSTNSIFLIPTRATAQIIRFLGAGGLATLLHWGVMAALIACGISALAATTIGAVAGALANYRLQTHWVFKRATHRTGHRPHRLAAYVCIVPLGWCVNAGVFSVLAAYGQIWLAQVGAHATVTAANFMLYRNVVFHARTD